MPEQPEHPCHAHLVGLLRPAWRRALGGQPHLACEYLFSETGISIRLWVPGVIPPGLVERAIEAAWPDNERRPPLVAAVRAPDIGWVARLGAAADDVSGHVKPLYLREADAQPQQAGILPRR